MTVDNMNSSKPNEEKPKTETNANLQSEQQQDYSRHKHHTRSHTAVPVTKTISDSEFQKLQELFRTNDRDGDGVLNVTELHQFLSEIGQKITEKQTQELIQKIHRHNTETISFKQFIRHYDTFVSTHIYSDTSLSPNTSTGKEATHSSVIDSPTRKRHSHKARQPKENEETEENKHPRESRAQTIDESKQPKFDELDHIQNRIDEKRKELKELEAELQTLKQKIEEKQTQLNNLTAETESKEKEKESLVVKTHSSPTVSSTSTESPRTKSKSSRIATAVHKSSREKDQKRETTKKHSISPKGHKTSSSNDSKKDSVERTKSTPPRTIVVTPTRTTSDTVQKKEESDTKQKQQRHKEEKERMREKYEQLRKEKGDVQVGDKSYPLYDIERAQTIIRHWLLRRKFKRFNAKIVKQYVESSHSLQLRRRNAALKEIVTSERTYVRHLEKIMEVFIEPLKHLRILSESEMSDIFSDIEILIDLNKILLNKLESRLAQWPAVTLFGDIFREYAPVMKLYYRYIRSFNNAMNAHQRIQEENVRYADFLQSCYMTKTGGLDLSSFLIMPVQRLPRYELLLKNLADLTPSTHVDHQNLVAAYNEVRKVNEYINERKKKDEAKDMMMSVLARHPTMRRFDGVTFQSPLAYLKITLHGAKNLLPMDPDGNSDPFVVISFGDEKLRSKVKKKTLNPDFDNEEFALPIFSDSPAEFTIEVRDWDPVGSNDDIGEIVFKVADFEKCSQPTTGWYTLTPMSKRARKKGKSAGEIHLSFLYQKHHDMHQTAK